MTRLRMAVIGVGHLGKEHARILASLPDVELVGVVDVNLAQAQAVAERCGTRAFKSFEPLLSEVDAATVVVPTTYHFDVAREFLRHHIPVLIEKPLAANFAQATMLVEQAEQRGVVLQVGHIERFNPALEELQRRPFQPQFITCERVGPFSGRSTDIGVVLDLMIHDLDVLLALVPAPVRSVESLGISLFSDHEDVAHAHIVFENGCVANVTASRASPQPSRQLRLWAAEGYAHVDYAKRRLTLIQPSAEMRRLGPTLAQRDPGALGKFKEEFFGRHFQAVEMDCNRGDQLTHELQHFVHCVRTGERPRVSGAEGRDAIALATRILADLRAHRWNSPADGAAGPTQLPAPLTTWIAAAERKAA